MTAAGHARRIVEGLDDEVRHDLQVRPLAAIGKHFDLRITPATSFEKRGANGWCDGASIIKAGVILYRPTYSRRENFTLLHELGHHLIAVDSACPAWAADQPEPRRLIEQVCDHIAALLLIPRAAVDAALNGDPVTAATVATLYGTTEASRTACAIAVAQRLPCQGFVLLTRPGTGTVLHASRAHEVRPYPWRDDPLPRAHPLARQAPPTRTLAWWEHRDGRRREFYMTTADIDGITCGVLAENDLWGIKKLHLPQQVEEDRGYDGHITCPCGYTGPTRWWPCKTCDIPICPRCQECECDRRARNQTFERCASCIVSVRSHLLQDGLCPDCQ